MEKLNLQESLALYRTFMANERTFLAYVRTSLALFIAGASLIRFFDDPLASIVGIILIPFGFILFTVGAVRYRHMKQEISVLERDGSTSDSKAD